MKKSSLILILLVIVVLFRNYFLRGPLVFGDAPYFYFQGLNELIGSPTLWMTRVNNLGGINQFLWIYPLMFLYGVLGTFLHLSNDLILRVLFYFPSLFFGFMGVYFLTKYLKFSSVVTFFATLFFLVNTYYLLIIDGGQVGIVLAYGIFPLVLLFLIKLVDKFSVRNFLIALVASFLLIVVDFRIFAICISTATIWKLKNFKNIWIPILLSICLIGLSAYWIIPILKTVTTGLDSSTAGLQTTSLLNTLLLSSPNWPANEFGKTVAPFFYFTLVPLLVFLPLFFTRQKKIVWLIFLFLLFAFLAKGSSDPFGVPYAFLVNTKLGSVFRDSTKFFIPLILIGGILIGLTVEKVNKKLFSIAVFVFLLFLVWQAFFGKLNGVLGGVPDISPYQSVYKLISEDNSFSRSLWFYEKSPFAYHTDDKQALDAKGLSDLRPFAAMNEGTSDRVNFVNNSQYLDWFKLLGIKYLIFNRNPRVVSLTVDELEDWNRLLNLVSSDSRLQKIDIGTSFPVYKNVNILPNKFFVDKNFVILGGDDIYQKLQNLDRNFSIANQGFLFPEDGKFNLASLKNVSSNSLILVFNNNTEDDLKMNFLQEDFTAAKDAIKSDWSTFSSKDYPEYKYQLLMRGVKFNDFDFGKGIAFSTKLGEKLFFKLQVPSDGIYTLAVRKMDDKNQNMQWFFESRDLKKGSFEYVYENKLGFEILNTIALISANDMKTAEQMTGNFMGYFKHFDIDSQKDREEIEKIIKENKWEELDVNKITKPGWIVYTDTYNPLWTIINGGSSSPSLPMYSAVNGFWVDGKRENVSIRFIDDSFRWGVYFSAVSFLVISISILWINNKNK